MPEKLNNVEYRQIKMKELFGLDLKKVDSKQISIFILFVNVELCKKHVKMAQKLPKIFKNDHYWTVFNNI